MEDKSVRRIKHRHYVRFTADNCLCMWETPWVNACIISLLQYAYYSELCKVRAITFAIKSCRRSGTWLLLLLILTSTATVLFADPKDVTVEANQWVQFNCTAHCDYPVRWYMAGHSRAILYNSSVPGLLIKRKSNSKCTSNQEIHFFEVYATEAWNKSAFYCAAYEWHHEGKSCSCNKGERCYSRPALLTGEHMLHWAFLT